MWARSRRRATACVERGTTCSSAIFMREDGMRHSAPSRSNSLHSASRNSPGRTNVKGNSRSADSLDRSPRYPSIARSNSPMRSGSVIAGRFLVQTAAMAPRRSTVGSRSARPVTTASRKTLPQSDRTLCAVSILPRASMRLSALRTATSRVVPARRPSMVRMSRISNGSMRTTPR